MPIRRYQPKARAAFCTIHAGARRCEPAPAQKEEAFLPLKIAADREGLLHYEGIFVAQEKGELAGFAACSKEELSWL